MNETGHFTGYILPFGSLQTHNLHICRFFFTCYSNQFKPQNSLHILQVQKLRLREVRQPTQSEELDKTAFEPRSSLTSKAVLFLAILSLFVLLWFVAFSVSFLCASSLPPLTLKLLSFHPHLFIFSREPDLWAKMRKFLWNE